ncbi:hypothetical protein AN958_05464 [Leucoagaricus sp. SymC.cos]|nr:hypothetical protein AN958_05464 [Leucoagaricus sp. SymC.cos]
MDETFVNVWLDHNEPGRGSKEDFYSSWIDKASAKHSDPGLIGSHRLRTLYPKHSLVSTQAYDLNILSYPGLTATPLPNSSLITNVVFVPFARSLHGVPGVLIDQVKVGAFQVVWKTLMWSEQYPFGFGTISQSYLLHEGPEERARLLLMTIGAWSKELHDEVWVFNQGWWNKDHGLWEEIQKANWNDVILKDAFKNALQKDVYGFFASEEIYKKLVIPWKQRGLIMHGPPGNGKTISVKAIMKSCNENGFVPLYVKSFQSWKGEEGAMADVFDQARRVAPACLILEDLDSLINERNRSYFLNQLDGLDSNNGLIIIGTTNHFDRLDPGLSSRPSRFDRKYLFDDPDEEERALYARYWQKKLSDNLEIDFPDVLVDSVARLTQGFSFAYLKEAFVSTLVTLAGIPGEKPPFGKLLKEQIYELRKQLDGEKQGINEIKLPDAPVQPSSPRRPAIPDGPRDVRVLFDALNDRISQGSTREKLYGILQQAEPTEQLDADARRVRNLLDSLSDSIANMNTSSRIYRTQTWPDTLGQTLPKGVEPGFNMVHQLAQATSRESGHRAFQRQLPVPPGPAGMPWGGTTLARPAPLGPFIQPRPENYGHNVSDTADLA